MHCSLVLPHRFSDRVRLGASLKEFLVCSDGRRAEAQPVSLRWGKPHPTFFDSKYIAILTKFYTRRAAEDSTRLYGEAAQRRIGLCEDCYIYG